MTYLQLIRPLTILLLASGLALAQQTSADAADVTAPPSATLVSQFFENDFFDIFGFANATYDTALPLLRPGTESFGSAWGVSAGGGLSAGHKFKDGVFSLSYRGDYRHYFSSSYSNGTDQSLSLLFSKRLSRHWSLGIQASGGSIVYGGDFYTTSPTQGSTALANPLSNQSRFVSSGVNLTYEQSRRLSYTFGGQFFLSNYNFAQAVNSVGGSGTASVNYRLTGRTTIGASYTRSYFAYSGSGGDTTINGEYLTASHVFSGHWNASVSGGVSETHSKGIITVPILFLFRGVPVTGYVTGPYDRTNYAPTFQGTISRNLKRSLLSITGGQGINAGNGTYLASKDQFANGTLSFTRGHRNLSFGGGYTRLVSVASTISNAYSTATISGSYGFNVARYLSANVRYDFIHYADFYSLKGLNESRFSLGFSIDRKGIPLTLF